MLLHLLLAFELRDEAVASDLHHYLRFHLLPKIQGAASQWAAERVRKAHGSKLDAITTTKEGRPVLFTGEVSRFVKFSLFFQDSYEIKI